LADFLFCASNQTSSVCSQLLAYINTPTTFVGLSGQRQNDLMQTGGFTWSLNERWTLQGTGGSSNHGGMGRAEVNYISPNLVFFAAGSLSAPLFPLNQVFSLFSGTRSMKSDSR